MAVSTFGPSAKPVTRPSNFPFGRNANSLVMDILGGAAGGPSGSNQNSGYSATYYPSKPAPAEAPPQEGLDHPHLLIVLGAATLGSTRLIDNVDVVPKDGED